MISRRSFLKISGYAAVALSTGYVAGKLVNSQSIEYFSVYGFIPGDDEVVKGLVKSFYSKVNSGSMPSVFADGNWAGLINSTVKTNLSGGKINFRMKRLNSNVDSDIIISDSKIPVYNPECDFNSAFSSLRTKIKNRKAEYLFNAEYKAESLFSALFNINEKIVVVENEKGIVEKIGLDNSYRNIIVNGPQGKTGIAIENGLVHIHTSTCKNRLCKNSGFISEPGKLIACAPNKVLIRIETV